jgi:hypothetical protein
MKFLPFKGVCFCVLVAFQASAATIVINEIMYHPAPATPEDKRREWIELHNAGTNAVDLSGWRFADGVEYTFPASTVLQPGAYVVVAANRLAFQTEFPAVANVLGDWTGQLSNTGEKIELIDTLGETVTSVRYADAGDWAVRQRVPDPTRGQPSWDWLALHDGQGPSLELINPTLPNGAGQNWLPSQITGGTPGAANSTHSANIAPLILETTHLPAIPRSTDPVTITARLVDEQTHALTAAVFYRDATTTTPNPNFTPALMFDDGAHGDGLAGDGLYGAILPAQAHGTVIEFYLQATDAGSAGSQGPRTRTWPAPALELNGTSGQFANANYQVDDETYTGTQPILRLILTGAERQARATFDQGNTASDAQQNLTLIIHDGVRTEIRYCADMRIRGAGSRGRATKNYRVNLPSDRPWNGLTAINLNSQYPHAQMIGSIIAQKARIPAANARFVQVRVNAVNLARSGPPTGGDGASWGTYALLEPINNEWAGRIFPLDGDGNVYRASTGNHNADLSLGPDAQYYRNRGYDKTSNSSDDDWSDLMALTAALSDWSNPDYANAVRAQADVESWMRYFAVFTLLTSMETSLGTGRGDDYGMYRGLLDARFQLIGHDFDTILGQGDTGGQVGISIFRMVPGAGGNANVQNLTQFMYHPEFAPIYFAQLKHLADTWMTPAQLNPIIDQFLSGVVTEPTKDAMKNFAAARVANVLGQIPQAISINTTLPLLNGYPTTTTPLINLAGLANAIHTRTVRVNGQNANWTAYQGAWNITHVPLTPGLNRILVQTFDTQGAETERATLDIWYDDASVVDITSDITTDTTWTAAGGPYRITGTIEITATLTIEPGTTVYLGSGAGFLVNGRLLAEGTDTQRIHFTREPGTTTRWGGLNIQSSTLNIQNSETRIAYAHFQFNNSTAIHSDGGTLFLDHLTFGSTDRQYLSLDRSSFIVQDCVFPATTAGFEPVHGTGGIKAGGRGIVRRNFWGKVQGYNDAFDFTGGNRPGPILQILNNVFAGSDDDLLDLDSTDAWVEGNIFLHVHRNGSPDSASAVSGGADNADTSQITIIGNLFYDVDHAANAKQGNFYTLINNTIVHQTRTGSQDTNTAVVILADETQGGLTLQGAGMYLEGNIILDAENLTRNVTTALVTYTNNIIRQLTGATWTGDGGNNADVDPLFKHLPQYSDTTNFTSWAAAQVMREWFSLQAGSPARGAGPNGRDLGAVQQRAAGILPAEAGQDARPTLGASISGEPVGTSSTSSVNTATLTVGVNRTGNGIPTAGFPEGSGFTHYRWRLDGGAWSAETPIATPISLSGLANGEHYVEVSGRNDAGFYQDDAVFGPDALVTRSRTWTVNTTFASVRLNELLALNQSALAHEGTYPDAVEIHNAGAATVDLSGWGLTDEATNRFKFKFPADTMLAPGQHLVIFADNRTGASGLHLGFGLDQAGDGVYLYDPSAALMDSVQFGIQLPDLSIGRGADGQWTLCTPTFGAANVTHALSDPYILKINEWLANGRTIYPDDFVEIYNPASAPVLLGGLHLTDEPQGWPGRHRVPPLTFMAGGAHFLFIADGDPSGGADHLDFKLSSRQEAIGLFDAATNLIDCVFYGPQVADTSEGRRPSGGSDIARFTVPTPGAPNPGPAGSTIIITTMTQGIFGVLDKQWRYHAAGIDLGTAWRATGFDDSSWNTGFALFGFETTPQVYPFPFQTTIPSPDQGGPNTAYFRTHFNWTNGTGWSLVASNYIDDGAVFYLNGVEAGRLRITANPVLYTSGAQNASDGNLDVITLNAASLVNGDNVLAVEVHQPGGGSSDDVFGMSLGAATSQTNIIVFGLTLNEVLARNMSFTNDSSGGTNAADWFELYNPSTNAFNLSGLSVSDHLDNPRRWMFPNGVVLGAGEYLVVRCDPDAPASTNAGTVLNTGFGLDGEGGDAVYVFDTLARGGALMDSVVFGLQVPDYSVGRAPNASGPWALALPTPGTANITAALGSAANLKVNEWLANPSGNDDDFLELYNINPQPVALGGLYLSDSVTNRTTHRIQDLSFIGAGEDGFARFIADGNTENGADHLNFSLRGAGESVALFSASQSLIDAYTFGAQENGVSEGRFPDGSTNVVRFRGTGTPGRSNLLPIDNIAINEALTHSDPPFEDAIELRNVSAAAVDISGWWLSDRRTDPKRFRIPNGTVLAPGDFVVFYEGQLNPDFTGRPPYFALSSTEGEELFLHTADAAGTLTGFRTSVKFGAGENGVSFGRFATSVDFDFTAMSQHTFGVDNPATVGEFRAGTGLSNAYPLVGPIVISEIMYHPPDLISGGTTNDNDLEEFIELHNITATNVPLYHAEFATNTWRLRDAVDFDFPMNLSLPAGGRLLVVGFDPATNAATLTAFRDKYGIALSVPIYGPWRGKLANDGENVELYKPDAPQAPGLPDAGLVPYIQVDKVKYADAAPWPALADGNTNGVGMSLQRLVAAEYGNDPVNWIAGTPTPGAATGPAALTPPSITSITAPHDVPPGANDSLVVAATGGGTLSYQWRFNGEIIPGATFATHFLNNFQAANAGVYSVIVVNGAGSASASTRVDLRSPPIIVRQPQDQVAPTNSTAVFTVAAGGTQPSSYQWQKISGNGVEPVPAANGPSLVFPNVQVADAAGYRVVITNIYGSVTSTVATLSIVSPPVITAQPQGTNAFVSQSVTFSVGVFGTPPLRYQWRFNGANIPDATNSTLSLANLQLTNAGSYSVRITNSIGSALSQSAILVVAEAPIVTILATDAFASETPPGPGANPGEFTLTRSGSVSFPQVVHFTVSAPGLGQAIAAPGLDYVALASPVTIPAGSAATTLPVFVLNDATREGNESVVVTLSGGFDYVAGPPATDTVVIMDDDNLAPSVTLTSPADGLVETFPSTILLAAVASDPDGSVAKVEYFNHGTNLLGQDALAPYTLNWTNAPLGTHLLTAVATDDLGSATVSAPVTVVVNDAPTVAITSPSNGAILEAGSNVVITATASDADGSVTVVEFYEGANLLSSDSSSPYTFLWNNPAIGEYALTAQATDNRGATRVSAPVSITVGVALPRFADNFASRGVISGFTNHITGTNTTYTREPGEPRHDNRNGNHSAWLSWTAPFSGHCAIDTLGSSFDTVLAVYTGTVLSNLVKIASNDDANTDVTQSRLTFNATNGVTYQIAVDGFATNAFGSISFHLSLPNPYPVFVTQPQSQVVNQGANVTFTVTTTGPAPQTFQWRFNGNNLNNQTNTTLNRNNVTANNAGTYVVVASNPSGSVTSAPATLTVRTSPTITTQPQDLAVSRDSNALFTVRATGFAPFEYQWYHNGAPIAGATSSNLVLLNVQGRLEGLYSATVSNSLGGAVSRNAQLTVNDGLVITLQTPILDLAHGAWRFEGSGQDLGTAWRAPGYDDTGWSNGVALFGLEDSRPYPYPQTILTPLRLRATNGAPIVTYYFRTAFSVADKSAITGLRAEAYVDDGAVLYLNGREGARLRIPGNIPADGVTNTVLAQSPNTEGQAAILTLPLTNIVTGENLLAVEVHQSSATSSDVVFGMALSSLTSVTNGPVLRAAVVQPNGVEVTLEGIPGRNYALDHSTNLVNWTPLTIWTNFTGTALHIDPAPDMNGNRFYRGRVAP